MSTQSDSSTRFTDLRKRAQVFLGEKETGNTPAMSPEDIQKLVHELHTYQIELELQNEDLRQAQIELEKNRKHFIDLYDFAPVGYLTVSDKGLILEANLTAAEMLGEERSKLCKQPLSAFIANTDQEIYYQHRRELLSSKLRQSCELRIQKKGQGAFLHVQLESVVTSHIDGGLGRFRVCLTDITKLKETEKKLRQSRDEWEKTFDSIPDIVTLQDKNLRIVRANRAAYHLLDIPAGELIGKKCYEIFRGTNTPCPACPLLETLGDRKDHSEVIHHENLDKIFLVTSAVIKDAHDEAQFLIHVAKDITDYKRLEEELFQSHKMEAIGTLAGGIAHDFNNILSAIVGFTELAREAQQEGSQAAADLEEVLRASRRAADLIKQILTFSQKGLLKRESLQPHLIAQESLKMLRASLPASIEIEQSINPECGSILADPTQIHQIIVNLCTNALHALEEETGTLKISLARCQLSAEEIQGHPGIQPGPFIKLSVCDNGCGMDHQTRERIFEPYFTTKETGKGTGLGLSVVLGIVQDSEGMIKVESEPGEGTAFHVFFPAIMEETTEQIVEDLAPIPRGTERILSVDDESSIVTLHKAVLSRLGYSVTAMSNSQEVLAAFKNTPEAFDLIITDQTMPLLSGAKLSEELLRIRPDIPIIICTGYSSTLSEERAMEIGIKKMLDKPLETRELAKAVREVLDQQ